MAHVLSRAPSSMIRTRNADKFSLRLFLSSEPRLSVSQRASKIISKVRAGCFFHAFLAPPSSSSSSSPFSPFSPVFGSADRFDPSQLTRKKAGYGAVSSKLLDLSKACSKRDRDGTYKLLRAYSLLGDSIGARRMFDLRRSMKYAVGGKDGEEDDVMLYLKALGVSCWSLECFTCVCVMMLLRCYSR